MNILVNALSARLSGGVTYLVSILNALAKVDLRNNYSVLLSSRYQSHLFPLLPPRFTIYPVSLSAHSLFQRWLFQQFVLHKLVRQHSFHLLFNVSDIAPIRVLCPMVILVQDFTIYSQPKVKKHWRDQAWFYGRQLLRRPLAYIALREASRVVFGSETIRKRVVPMMRIPSKKTRIVYLGVDPSFQGRDHANRPLGNRPYFIVISTVLSYKDLKTAISAFAHASPTMQNGNVDLIIVGEILDRELHQALCTSLSIITGVLWASIGRGNGIWYAGHRFGH